jgi:hypothetical protein
VLHSRYAKLGDNVKLYILGFFLVLTSCASKPVIPSAGDVKVSREDASPKCKEIGKLTGTTMTAQGTKEQALEDLKREAATKGGNYVVVKQFSDYGTAVTGIAYDCP